jgi:hypothetical protein
MATKGIWDGTKTASAAYCSWDASAGGAAKEKMVKKVLISAAVAAMVLPAAANAKGPSQAIVTGPGLDRPVVLRAAGDSEGGSGTLGRLTMEGGFFVEVFGQQPDPRLLRRPLRLGPRYRVDYLMVGPKSTKSIHQDLYPYAADGVVTHMSPGQPFWDGQESKGGWMRAPELAPGQETLRAALVLAGLPDAAVRASSRSRLATVWWAAAGVLVATLGAGGLLALRRRPRSVSAERT